MLALLISLFLVIPGSTGNLEMADQVGHDEETVDVAEIIFEHIGDDYEWHLLTWGDKHVKLHLPVIVHSSTGWHVFSSKRLAEYSHVNDRNLAKHNYNLIDVEMDFRF